VRRHRLIMSELMMRAQIGVQKSTRKWVILGTRKKWCFWRGRRKRGKWGNGLEQGDGHGVKKFLGDKHGVVEWDGFKFMSNKFLNGLWGRDFGGDFGRAILVGFGSGGEEWCGTEMM
jgi:hypothetical protein